MTAAGSSLQRRLILAALVFVVLALAGSGLSIGFILHRFVRGQVDGRLDDRIRSLLADLERDPAGLADGRFADAPPFDRPRSGWYWQVRQGERVIRSASLEGRDLALPDMPHPDRPAPPGARPADGTGPWGESLILRVRTQKGRPRQPPVEIMASAPASALRKPVLEALRTLAISLAVTGLFLLAGAVLQVRLGLRPLERLRRDLAEIRAGRLARLPEEQPAEIRPLVGEMNAVLDQNEAGLAGARAQVANLAHGLKTPLATLSMALAERGGPHAGELSRLVEAMDGRVRHHLRRARAAASLGPVRQRVPLAPRLRDLRAVFLKLHAEKGVALALVVPDDLAVACDPQDLDEMLGNLVENACRWCRTTVRVEARAEAGGRRVLVAVEDDGPGLPPDRMAEVLQRGRRLDESQPGHGFGLPIAAELAGLYGGALDLGRAELGGLRATLALPA